MEHIISDNGTNFAAVKTQKFAVSLNILWHLNIPLAPLYGGLFEPMNQILRYLNQSYLRKQMGNARLTVEEAHTVLLEIECLMNNRPITYSYPNELEQCLISNHLIFGNRLKNKATVYHNKDNISSNDTNLSTTHCNKLSPILRRIFGRFKGATKIEIGKEQQTIDQEDRFCIDPR